MTSQQVGEYIQQHDEPKRSTLAALRDLISQELPTASQEISYGAPVWVLDGKKVAGFCSFKNHLVYSTHGKTVTEQLASDLADFKVSKASFQFGVDQNLPQQLVAKLIATRLAE